MSNLYQDTSTQGYVQGLRDEENPSPKLLPPSNVCKYLQNPPESISKYLHFKSVLGRGESYVPDVPSEGILKHALHVIAILWSPSNFKSCMNLCYSSQMWTPAILHIHVGSYSTVRTLCKHGVYEGVRGDSSLWITQWINSEQKVAGHMQGYLMACMHYNVRTLIPGISPNNQIM